MPTISLAIPTYNREEVLLSSIREALRFRSELVHLLVVDQTREHKAEVASTLATWHDEGKITWVKLETPSLPRARNVSMAHAEADILIFIDDDVLIDDGFVQAHREAYLAPDIVAVAGRVKPPQETPPSPQVRRTVKLLDYRHFNFNSVEPLDDVGSFPGGNHSLRVSVAQGIGGYDEGYTGNALREETDLALRLMGNGHRIVFAPGASLIHLAAPTGGCRVTDYSRLLGVSLLYFAIKHRRTLGWFIIWDFWRAARCSFLNKVVPIHLLPRQLYLFLRFWATRRPRL